MSRFFKTLKPYWKSVLLIIALLVLQAYADLSLPQYTSDIIDVGILKSGVEHVLPEAVTAEEFETAEFIMTDREMEVWEGSYEEDGDVYRLLVTDQALLDSLDEELSVPLIMNYQMSAMEEQAVKELIAAQTGTDAKTLESRCSVWNLRALNRRRKTTKEIRSMLPVWISALFLYR